jgi:pimeloyl-ACP methyl ester carboxylesterase
MTNAWKWTNTIMRLTWRITIYFAGLLTASTAMAQITVNCLGTGQPVYLIGGGPAFTTWNLEPIQQQLRTSFKVCRWDMRGVGDNASLAMKENVPVLTQWLQDMADVLPDEPVILWGHSWGALQSLLFARHNPERVRALVLNNPVDPALASLENIESKRYVHPYVESHLNIEDIDTPAEQRHRFRSKIASYFLDAKKGWQYSAQFDHHDTNNRLNVQIWHEYRQMPLAANDLKALSPKISRLIYCKQDVLMPESFDQYSAVVPPDKHYSIDDCAHFPWVESPNEFYDILLRSLTDVH